MNWEWAGAMGLVLAAALAWRPLRRWGREIQIERARELFVLQRERLEKEFTKTAAASGKPRGLRWHECQFEKDLQLARDRNNGQIVGFVSLTIKFEAVEGGDMEGVEAVDYQKNASAVFYFQNGQWQTAGKALFNLNPNEVLDRYGSQYERAEANVPQVRV